MCSLIWPETERINFGAHYRMAKVASKKVVTGREAEDWQAEVNELHANGYHTHALALVSARARAGHVDRDTLAQLALCYFNLGDFDSGVKLCGVLVQKWPEDAEAWVLYGNFLNAMGHQDQAVEKFERALKVNPYYSEAIQEIYRLKGFSNNSLYVSRLKKIIKPKSSGRIKIGRALNLLGTMELKSGNGKAAFRYFAQSKASQLTEPYDTDEFSRRVALQKDLYRPHSHSAENSDGPKVLFVCGLPRSGTTLCERILLRHSDVASVGESQALIATETEVQKFMHDKGHGRDRYNWVEALTDDDASVFRKYYYERAMFGQDRGDVIVDKMPQNVLSIGLAKRILPDAKFVFLARHPLDVALSNFSIYFTNVLPYTCRLEWMAGMIRTVYDSVLDYEGKLPRDIRSQSFRALVTDPEVQIRALLEHCGLDWQEACLSPEKGDAMVRTASLAQVQEKINTHGLDKWKKFERELAPVTEALGGEAWLEQWERWDARAAQTGRLLAGAAGAL